MLQVFRESPHRRWNPLSRDWVIESFNDNLPFDRWTELA